MSSYELHATSSFAAQAPPASSSTAPSQQQLQQQQPSYVVPPNSTVFLSRAADAPPRMLVVTPRCPSSMLSGLGREHGAAWKLEDYDLHRQLYKGKASLLYSATCRASGTRVALKLYRKARLSELNWYQVAREVCLHSRLSHPHVVDLFAAFEDKDHIYLVQEYASGGDLYEALKRAGGKLKESAVAGEVVAPCLDAVAYLHSLGIIHRDIKPENILLCPVLPPPPASSSPSSSQQQNSAAASSSIRDSHHSQHPDAITTTGGDPSTGGVPGSSSSPSRTHVVKLADFGLSIDGQAERPVTRAGTLDYMAPEVREEKRLLLSFFFFPLPPFRFLKASLSLFPLPLKKKINTNNPGPALPRKGPPARQQREGSPGLRRLRRRLGARCPGLRARHWPPAV
jgi:serine/threonine protein kinase